MKGLDISSIQRGSVHDGTGMRTTVFLNGCRLKCPWCCNPETSISNSPFVDFDQCKINKKQFPAICDKCELNHGNRPKTECPFSLVSLTSKLYSQEEIYEILAKDFELFKISGGGVTFSGGEPLLQYDALLPLLMILKKQSVNIAVETTLFVPDVSLLSIVPFIDEFIIDLKLQSAMFLRSDRYIKLINERLQKIIDKEKIFRVVFVNEMHDKASIVADKLLCLGIKHIELLKCHNLAQKKYMKLSIPFADYSASTEKMSLFQKQLTTYGITSEKLS